MADGDGRYLLNMAEEVFTLSNDTVLDTKALASAVQKRMPLYDKSQDGHYNLISALHKSLRGSDADAALYWFARMLAGGEDSTYILRRLVRFASEDIGLANPTALVMANTCFDAVAKIGYPECDIILSQTVIYLATSPKSNSAYKAIRNTLQLVKETGDLSVPLHLRNAPTKLMKQLDYGKNYKYAHGFQGNFVNQEFLPPEISGEKLYEPGVNPKEKAIQDKLKLLWKEKYGY